MNDASIVIESKVDADESPRQCDILYERFVENVGAHFVFLTPTGRNPATASDEAAGAFVSLSFAAVREALDTALIETSEVSALWGRRAAEDYLRTLKREFR